MNYEQVIIAFIQGRNFTGTYNSFTSRVIPQLDLGHCTVVLKCMDFRTPGHVLVDHFWLYIDSNILNSHSWGNSIK